jgi:hypothetical protein
LARRQLRRALSRVSWAGAGWPPETASKSEKGQHRATQIVILRVPRLRLGTRIVRALPGNYLAFWSIMEAEPPGHAFPGGAWEREVISNKQKTMIYCIPSVTSGQILSLRAERSNLQLGGLLSRETRDFTPRNDNPQPPCN